MKESSLMCSRTNESWLVGSDTQVGLWGDKGGAG